MERALYSYTFILENLEVIFNPHLKLILKYNNKVDKTHYRHKIQFKNLFKAKSRRS